MFFPPPGGATEYIAYRSMRYMDFARATITRDIFIPGPTQCALSRSLKQAKHTTFYKFEEGISFVYKYICCVHFYFYMKQTFVRFRNLFSFYRL